MKSLFYLPFWFFNTRFLGAKKPLQTVLFVSDKCNLACKHCTVYQLKNPHTKTYEQIRAELERSYRLGSRFVDFEGGEPTLWRDGNKDLNSLIRLAKKTGYFSTTITTNAQLPFTGSEADSIWVSLDGIDKYHDAIRGRGAFDRLVKNIETARHPHLSVNMVVNSLNYISVEETIEFAKKNPHIRMISLNFHTPYEGTEDLFLDWDQRAEIIDLIISKKKAGYPIMNSISGLKLMKRNNFKKQCWVSDFVLADGTYLPECQGSLAGVCDRCGFSMAGEMYSVMHLKPDTVLAGMKLRI
ncbi:MAG: radical SAM protein [Dysgonamonadaceae bacterium]|jgi:MoaA/NifB/PqqE/SkfB family radical SAM enzyme|nr:radical SAM protein [Dysgonamonadaceae bacterium]